MNVSYRQCRTKGCVSCAVAQGVTVEGAQHLKFDWVSERGGRGRKIHARHRAQSVADLVRARGVWSPPRAPAGSKMAPPLALVFVFNYVVSRRPLEILLARPCNKT